MASFDEEDKPVAHGSSSEGHKEDSHTSTVKCATKSLASAWTMDDDPDFIIPHEASGPAQRVSDNTRSTKQTKATSQTSGKVISTKSRQNDRNRTSRSLPKGGLKHKTSTNASQLANYLLQCVDGGSETVCHKDRVSHHETTCMDRDTCEEYGGECKIGDGVESFEWFGFDSEEDLDNFEHFDDEADF